MDALRNAKRNGLDGDFFNFVPPPLIAAAAGVSISKKSKARRYQNQKATDLSIKYPHKLTSEEQDETISKVANEQRKVIEQKNDAKGSKRAKLNAELKGYDEYLNDLRLVRDELLAKEKEAISQLKQQKDEPKPTSSLEEVTKEDEVLQSATPSNTPNITNVPTPLQKSNNLIYIGLAAVVLVGIVFIMRKK